MNYNNEAIEACVKLTQRYITDRAFPDKAIDALDEVGSRIHLHNADVPNDIVEMENTIREVKEKSFRPYVTRTLNWQPTTETSKAVWRVNWNACTLLGFAEIAEAVTR